MQRSARFRASWGWSARGRWSFSQRLSSKPGAEPADPVPATTAVTTARTATTTPIPRRRIAHHPLAETVTRGSGEGQAGHPPGEVEGRHAQGAPVGEADVRRRPRVEGEPLPAG